MRPKWHDGLHRALNSLAIASGLAGTAFGAALKAPAEEWSKHSVNAGYAIKFMQDWAWLVVPISAAVAAVALWARDRVKPPWFWGVLTYLLDRLRAQAYADRAAGDPEYHHRVTIFEFQKWHFCFRRWPWSGWLRAVKRSGHLTHGTRLAFSARDDGRCEGVAGQTWAADQVIVIHGLQQLKPETSLKRLQAFAQRTGVSVDWLKKHPHDAQARSFVGIPIKVGGRRWGVVVLDSRSPGEIPIEASSLYPELVPLLSRLLMRRGDE